MKKLLRPLILSLLIGCSFYGRAQSVFPVKFQSEATVKLAEVGTSSIADLIVYKVSSDTAVGNNNGLWYFPAFPDSTSKKIFFVSDTPSADLKVYFTSSPSEAGWINTSRMSLLN